jgi:hypothetical protein
MKRIFFAITAVMLTFTALGQNAPAFYESGYVLLKNGSLLKGRYAYSSGFDKLRVVSGKNTWIFNADEVEMTSRKRPDNKPDSNNGFLEQDFTLSRFFYLADVGILAGNPDNSQSAPMVLGTSVNYTFLDNLSAGVGVGVEFLKETYLPLTANILYRLRESRFTPFVMVQAGYQFPAEDSRQNIQTVFPEFYSSSSIWPGPWPVAMTELHARGGFMVNPSLGFISLARPGYGLSLAVGYRFHRLGYTAENDYRLDVDFNRLSVKFGFIIH